MKNALIGLAGLLFVLGVVGVEVGRARQADTPKKLDEKASLWMVRKLEFSQNILAALTRGDFDLLEKNASEMYVVGYLEKWDMADLPSYRKQVKIFDDSTRELIRQAKAKNVPAATKAYTQLIASCVECHQAECHNE